MSPPPALPPAEPPVDGMPPGGAPGADVAYDVPAPEDGYSKRTILDLAEGLQKSMSAVAKATHNDAGEVPDVPDEAFQKGRFLSALPAGIVKTICDLLKMAAQVGGKVEGRYDGDILEMLSTDEGAKKVAILLELVAKDKVLLQKIADAFRAKSMAGAPPKDEAEPAEEAPAEESAEPAPKAGPSDYM